MRDDRQSHRELSKGMETIINDVTQFLTLLSNHMFNYFCLINVLTLFLYDSHHRLYDEINNVGNILKTISKE